MLIETELTKYDLRLIKSRLLEKPHVDSPRQRQNVNRVLGRVEDTRKALEEAPQEGDTVIEMIDGVITAVG
jgi:hypothetical protein